MPKIPVKKYNAQKSMKNPVVNPIKNGEQDAIMHDELEEFARKIRALRSI